MTGWREGAMRHAQQPHPQAPTLERKLPDAGLTHLDRLEAESIYIMREAVAESDNPVMLYSIGKDSSVLLHLALKAFYPAKPPFPLLHVDTTWKFREMIAFRDRRAKELGLDLLVHTNPDGLARNIGPISHGSEVHTDVMKTQALKQALERYGFDAAFGGARRDEEKSRAKERVFRCATPITAGIPSASAPNPGSSTTDASAAARACASFRSRTGPSSTSGSTSTARTSRSFRSISPPSVRWWSETACLSWSMMTGYRFIPASSHSCDRSGFGPWAAIP